MAREYLELRIDRRLRERAGQRERFLERLVRRIHSIGGIEQAADAPEQPACRHGFAASQRPGELAPLHDGIVDLAGTGQVGPLTIGRFRRPRERGRRVDAPATARYHQPEAPRIPLDANRNARSWRDFVLERPGVERRGELSLCGDDRGRAGPSDPRHQVVAYAQADPFSDRSALDQLHHHASSLGNARLRCAQEHRTGEHPPMRTSHSEFSTGHSAPGIR